MKFIKLNYEKFNSIHFIDHLSRNKQQQIKKCMPKEKTFINQLAQFLQLLYAENMKNESLFTKKQAPFIIGINGSVSSGKSYFADQLQKILKCFNPNLKVGLLSTDNFIYSNKILESKKIFDKKGFTESYNWKLLLKTLDKIKKNKSVKTPYYSQSMSDIHPTKKLTLPSNLNILIIEGINLLKPTCYNLSENLCRKLLLSDYLDYSIYLETSEKNLQKWFHTRLNRKKTLWKQKKIKKNLTRKNKAEFKTFTDNIWKKYNHPNLVKNIKPFRYRSDMIIHKKLDHKVDFIQLKI